MRDKRAIAVAVVLALVATAWCYSRSGLRVTTDLLASFDTAMRQPGPHVFQLREVEIDGTRHQAITVDAAATGTRVTWKRVRIPDGAWLRVDLAVLAGSGTDEPSPVQFLVGASDGRTFEELAQHTLDPAAGPDQRRWIPLMLDLSLYVGEEIDLIFNTRRLEPEAAARRGVAAVWGAPAIVR